MPEGSYGLTREALREELDKTWKIAPIYVKDINRLITSLIPTGRVVFQDDMEGATILWKGTQISGGATGAGSIARDTSTCEVHAGAASMVIKSGFGAGASVFQAERHVGVERDVDRFGFEAWYASRIDNLDFFLFDMELDSQILGYRLVPEIVYDCTAGMWKYRNNANALVALPGAPAHTSLSIGVLFDYFKMVVDYKKQEYVYAFMVGTKVDMTGIKIYKATPAVWAHNIEPKFQVGSPAGAAGNAWLIFDNVVVTCDEP